MKTTLITMTALLAAATAGCGAATGTTTAEVPTPTATATPDPGMAPQLRPTNLAFTLGQSKDPYEPNDSTPYYLGAGTSYTITDAYLDPVDVSWSMDVVNDGGDVGNTFDVALHVGTDKVLTTPLDGIFAGETRTVNFSQSDADAGMQSAWGEVDSRGDVAESDENDNDSPSLDASVVADEDRFSVYQISGGTFSITLDQLPADYDLELLDPSGNLVASSRNAGLAAETISATASVSGNWIIRVFGYQGARSGSFPYHLQILAP